MLTTKTVRVTDYWDKLSKDPIFRHIPEACEMVPREELKKKRRWERFVDEDIASDSNGKDSTPMDQIRTFSWDVVNSEIPRMLSGNFPNPDVRPVPMNDEHHTKELGHQQHYRDATEERLALLGVTGEAKPRVWRGPATAPVEVIPAGEINPFDGSFSRERYPLPPSQEIYGIPPHQNSKKDSHGSENRLGSYNKHASQPPAPPPSSTTLSGENHTQIDLNATEAEEPKPTQGAVPLLRARSLKNQPSHRKSRSRSNSQERRRQADDDTPKPKRRQPQVAAAYRLVVQNIEHVDIADESKPSLVRIFSKWMIRTCSVLLVEARPFSAHEAKGYLAILITCQKDPSIRSGRYI
jgi:hypothetical protein